MAVRRSKWRVVTALVVIALIALPIVGSVARHPVEEPGPGPVVGGIATFRDSRGHTVDFKVRPNATGFATICS